MGGTSVPLKATITVIGGWPFDFSEGIYPLEKGGDAVEQETFIVILMILVIGYILIIKK